MNLSFGNGSGFWYSSRRSNFNSCMSLYEKKFKHFCDLLFNYFLTYPSFIPFTSELIHVRVIQLCYRFDEYFLFDHTKNCWTIKISIVTFFLLGMIPWYMPFWWVPTSTGTISQWAASRNREMWKITAS